MYEAADVRLPRSLRTVGVVDATRGEAELARGAVEGLLTFLATSDELDGLRSTCADGVDGLVSLDHIASRHASRLETLEQAEAAWLAELESQVTSSWTLATCGGEVLDRLENVVVTERWSAGASEEAAATSELPSPPRAAAELAFSAGIAYGRRIAPWSGDAVRTWFVSGDPRLGHARLAVLAGHWPEAMAIWREVANSPVGDRARARALHDLAVGHEVLGNYHLALSYAEEAAATHDNARIQRYRDLLRRLRTERRLLRVGEETR